MMNLFDPKSLVFAELEFVSPSRNKVDLMDAIMDEVFAEVHEVVLGLPYSADKAVKVQQRISIF